MAILVQMHSAFTRNIQSNQALASHSTAVKRSHLHLIPITLVRFCVRQMRCVYSSLKFYSFLLQANSHVKLSTPWTQAAPRWTKV